MYVMISNVCLYGLEMEVFCEKFAHRSLLEAYEKWIGSDFSKATGELLTTQ
jgi:hypothetical protein